MILHDAVALSVEDRGCGIPNGELPRIFEPFYRAESARRLGHAGVGLGLAVAHRIAETHGGAIAVESEPGRGSRFLSHRRDARRRDCRGERAGSWQSLPTPSASGAGAGRRQGGHRSPRDDPPDIGMLTARNAAPRGPDGAHIGRLGRSRLGAGLRTLPGVGGAMSNESIKVVSASVPGTGSDVGAVRSVESVRRIG
ncbi:MAG: sensor histidine kinase [Paludisphaera borealis]|uniref:sensor histidine kinase n=1 Tax=Paludisphaera borealis TaxID=1387353 RepID=UPI00283E88D5|nr:sensor histidine kinase [Paludisphaera borealis]MDR3622976.1 sensor histidine kinase [Paludisphaera borealis]